MITIQKRVRPGKVNLSSLESAKGKSLWVNPSGVGSLHNLERRVSLGVVAVKQLDVWTILESISREQTSSWYRTIGM